MLLNKSQSQPTVLFRFSTQVSVTRPGQFVNTTMAEIIKAWQDYLTEPLDSNSVIDNDEVLASAVNALIKTLDSFGYDDILLRTQVITFILPVLYVPWCFWLGSMKGIQPVKSPASAVPNKSSLLCDLA